MIDEDINEAEWALVQILANPVLFREFINEDTTPGWTPLEDHERAWSTCSSHYIVMCCGRSVHKTTSMIEMLYWWVVNQKFIRGEPGLFVLVPNKAQKDLSFRKIRDACLAHWLVKQYSDPNAINVGDGKIDFLNGFQLLMRLAGESGKETNVIGVHTYRIWVDEAQAIPWTVWKSLQNCLKKELDGYQMIVSGVPTGARKDNVLFECDQIDTKYQTFNIAQTMMSWWTPEMEFSVRKQYHANMEDTEDYKHFVLGQHGVPTFSVFDRTRFLLEPFETVKLVVTQHMIETSKRVDPDGEARYHLEEILIAPPLPLDSDRMPLVGLGYDVGYSPDPTVFIVLYRTKVGTWRPLIRYVLQRVEYPIQREAIAWLDTVYHFNFLGIDMGGPGKVQYQDLTNELSPYRPHKFLERMYPVEFGSYMLVAIDEGGSEKKDQTKRVAVDTLSRWVHEHRLSFAEDDLDLIEELERTKFTRTMTGEPVYRTDDDHQMAALMCAIMAYENKYGVPVIIERAPINVRLLAAKWLDPYDIQGSVQ